MDIVGKCTLDWPAGRVDAVLDTDAFNEVDDQFADSIYAAFVGQNKYQGDIRSAVFQ